MLKHCTYSIQTVLKKLFYLVIIQHWWLLMLIFQYNVLKIVHSPKVLDQACSQTRVLADVLSGWNTRDVKLLPPRRTTDVKLLPLGTQEGRDVIPMYFITSIVFGRGSFGFLLYQGGSS